MYWARLGTEPHILIITGLLTQAVLIQTGSTVASMTHDQVFLLLLEMQYKLGMQILYDGLP